MTNAWLPPEQYIETIARATSYACIYFTDIAGRPFQLRSHNKGDVCRQRLNARPLPTDELWPSWAV
ncbi:hypothetical protein ACFVHS_37680 [Streptomyces sp. NPDC057746]|uniref:hypothetical protein n=1 Tax=Streptomyces sp. NPDC057746 TaxID=3346237 RepID=UPI0036CB4F3A